MRQIREDQYKVSEIEQAREDKSRPRGNGRESTEVNQDGILVVPGCFHADLGSGVSRT